MKTLEEKIKEITELCHNLDEKIFATIKQRFPDNENIVCLDAGHLHATLDIDDEVEYNNLIDYLKQHQKQPELYTWHEIDRVGKKWIEERHTIKEHTSVFDYLKNEHYL